MKRDNLERGPPWRRSRKQFGVGDSARMSLTRLRSHPPDRIAQIVGHRLTGMSPQRRRTLPAHAIAAHSCASNCRYLAESFGIANRVALKLQFAND